MAQTVPGSADADVTWDAVSVHDTHRQTQNHTAAGARARRAPRHVASHPPAASRAAAKPDATEAGARARATPGAASRPLSTTAGNSTGREARPGAGPSGGGQFRAPTFLGRVFWRLTLGGRGLGWKSRPRGQVWSERPSRGFSGALQRCAQRDGAKQRPRGTRVPFTRRIPWRVGAPRAPLSKRLINRVELL